MIINRLNIESEILIVYVELTSAINNLDTNSYLIDGQEIEKYNLIKNPVRKMQFITERYILKEVLGKDYSGLNYNEFGKPFLNNSENYISITHTNKIVAVAFSRKNIGLDIEQARESLEKVKRRFLTEEEIVRLNPQTTEQLSFLWNLKEAALKFHGISNIDYQQCITITDCDFKNNAKIKLNINNKTVSLKSSLKKIQEHTLAVVYNDYNC